MKTDSGLGLKDSFTLLFTIVAILSFLIVPLFILVLSMDDAYSIGPIEVDNVKYDYQPPQLQTLFCKKTALSSHYYQIDIKPGEVIFIPSGNRLDGSNNILCSSEPFEGVDTIIDVLGTLVRTYTIPPVPPSW